MKYFILFIFIYSLFFVNSFAYEYITNIWWNNAKVFKITKDDEYKVIVSANINWWESLESLVKKVGWIAWINWAYFCPKDYPDCNWENFSDFDRISNWKIYSKWNNTWNRYFFWFTKENTPLIHKSPTIHPDTFNGIYNGLSNFPLILKDGDSYLENYENLLDEKMKAKWTKNFICSTKDYTIYMWNIYNQTIYSMVDLLKNLWCINALNLDSWWSLSFYDNWYKVWPWRDIMDAFVIVKKDKYEFKNNLSEKGLIKKESLESENINWYTKSNIEEVNEIETILEKEKNIFDNLSDNYNSFLEKIDQIKERLNYYKQTLLSVYDRIIALYDKFINIFS